MSTVQLTEILLQAGIVTRNDISRALNHQADHGGKIGSTLFELGMVSEKQLVHYLSKQFGIPGIDLSRTTLTTSVLRIIPAIIARKYTLIPLSFHGELLTVAMAEPHNERAIDELAFMTGRRISAYVAIENVIKQAIDRCYSGIPIEPYQRPLSDGGSSENTPAQMEIIRGSELLLHGVMSTLDDQVLPAFDQTLDPAVAVRDDQLPVIKTPRSQQLVLIVDDDYEVSAIWTTLLTEAGYRVAHARNGVDGLKKVRCLKPDLLILNALLAELNGFTLCERLKNNRHYRLIPIILVTSPYSSWQIDPKTKKNYNADILLEKPVSPTLLLEKAIQLLLQNPGASESLPDLPSDNIGRLIEQGIAAYKEKSFASAQHFFLEAIHIDGLAPKIHYYLGKTYEKTGDTIKAIASFEQAIVIDPHFFYATKDLALLYEKRGFQQKAIKLWEQAIATCTDSSLKQKIKDHLIRLLD